MSFLSSLFGASPPKKDMVIREILRFRIQTDPASSLMGLEPGLADKIPREQLYGLPEASIVTIVESYVQLVKAGTDVKQAIERIDSFRTEKFGGSGTPERSNVFDYIIARIARDHPEGGLLTEDFVDKAVSVAGTFFHMNLVPPARPEYHVLKDCPVGTARVILARYTRRANGYLYPLRMLVFDNAGKFIVGYNVEQTSLSCCLASNRADGSRMNFGECEPDISVADFEAWALPKMRKAIFGKELIEPAALSEAGIEWMRDLLEEEGYLVTTVNMDPKTDPQIYAENEEENAAFLVYTGAHPYPGVVAEESDSVEALVNAASEGGFEVYAVELIAEDWKGRNDYEKGAIKVNTEVEFTIHRREWIG